MDAQFLCLLDIVLAESICIRLGVTIEMSSSLDALYDVLVRSDNQRIALILLRLSHNITVSVRSLYRGTEPTIDDTKKFIGYNELLHLLSGIARSCLSSGEYMVDTRLLVHSIANIGKKYDIINGIDFAVNHSLSVRDSGDAS